jgi:hypothetical protein
MIAASALALEDALRRRQKACSFVVLNNGCLIHGQYLQNVN